MNREEYRCERGRAAFWEKDGKWHVARPRPEQGFADNVLFWTDEEYDTREEAIEALSVPYQRSHDEVGD